MNRKNIPLGRKEGKSNYKLNNNVKCDRNQISFIYTEEEVLNMYMDNKIMFTNNSSFRKAVSVKQVLTLIEASSSMITAYLVGKFLHALNKNRSE